MKQETLIQIQIVSALSMLAANHKFLFFSVPNEGFLLAVAENKMTDRNMAKLTTLKKMGLTSGVSDLVIAKAGRMYCLEVKAPGGTVSTNQRTFCAWCERTGIPYRVVYSVQETLGQLKAWGVI